LGPIRLRRSYRRCPDCGDGGFAADDLLGTGRFLTIRARRLACAFGLGDSFARAARLLGQAAGWTVGDETLRKLCHAEAEALARARPERLATAGHFARAEGDWELQVDAGKVNTEDGWRDVKLACFARRGRAEPASSADCEQRDLPGPSARSVVAAIEPAEDFGRRCRDESRRLGRPDDGPLSILGDGAEWIWNLAGRHFGGAEQVLDIFHAVGHLADLSRAGFGGDPDPAREWLDRARAALLADGWPGVCEFVAREATGVPDRAALEAAYPAVANYLAGHRDRLGYAARLRRGQAIGSGLIEGTIKQRVGQRMKRSGARWRSENVGRFVELCAIADGPEWDHYWSSAA
jgi:hypothetical protein